MSACHLDWLDSGGLDPLAPAFPGRLISGLLYYEERRELMARGASSGAGGSGRGRGRGRSAARRGAARARSRVAGERKARAALRSSAQAIESRVKRDARTVQRLAQERAYAARFLNRNALKRATAALREAERTYRAEAREGARARRTLAKFQIRPGERTAYQRRVVSETTRQIERLVQTSSFTDKQVIEQAKLRLRQMFPNAENYENPFVSLDYDADLARAILPLSNNQIWQLIRQRTGADFSRTLIRLRGSNVPLFSANPLFYHGEASRVQYGI